MAPFAAWTKDYAAMVAKAPPLPPEFKEEDPKTYRLIQACQMDARPGWWSRLPGATDGWVAEVKSVGWKITTSFSPLEDVVYGKRYKLFIRIKGSGKRPEGFAVYAGIYGKESKGNITKKIKATELSSDQFQTFEVGEFVASETMGSFWMSLPDQSLPKVYLDCLWLREVEK
jgi:hypothetical protein